MLLRTQICLVVNGMVGFNTTVFAYGCYGKNTFVATPGKNLGMGPPIPYKSLNINLCLIHTRSSLVN